MLPKAGSRTQLAKEFSAGNIKKERKGEVESGVISLKRKIILARWRNFSRWIHFFSPVRFSTFTSRTSLKFRSNSTGLSLTELSRLARERMNDNPSSVLSPSPSCSHTFQLTFVCHSRVRAHICESERRFDVRVAALRQEGHHGGGLPSR